MLVSVFGVTIQVNSRQLTVVTNCSLGVPGVEVGLLGIGDEDMQVRVLTWNGPNKLMFLRGKTPGFVGEVDSAFPGFRENLEDYYCGLSGMDQFASASVLTYLYRDSEEVEAKLVDCVGSLRQDMVLFLKLVRLLPIGGVLSASAKDFLLKLAERNEAGGVSVEAADILARNGDPPEELLPLIVAHIESDAAFASPRLVEAVLEFGTKSVETLPALIEVRQILEVQLALPERDRTKTIYAPDFTKEVLDNTIRALEAM